jgi:plasmid stability protein
MTVELAHCLADSGDLEGARQMLTETLAKMEAGPAAHAAAIDLSEICMRNGHAAQAVGVCTELLKSKCAPEVRRKAQELLGAAYAREKDYQRAAMVLSGKLPDETGGRKP